jgi:hypothetical protein
MVGRRVDRARACGIDAWAGLCIQDQDLQIPGVLAAFMTEDLPSRADVGGTEKQA